VPLNEQELQYSDDTGESQKNIYDLNIEYVIVGSEFDNANENDGFNQKVKNIDENLVKGGFKYVNRYLGVLEEDGPETNYPDNKGIDVRLIFVESSYADNWDKQFVNIDGYLSKTQLNVTVLMSSDYDMEDMIRIQKERESKRKDVYNIIVVESSLKNLSTLVYDKINKVRGKRKKFNDAGKQWSVNTDETVIVTKSVATSALQNIKDDINQDIDGLPIDYINKLYRDKFQSNQNDTDMLIKLNSAISIIRQYKQQKMIKV
jgi:hypothetical protein